MRKSAWFAAVPLLVAGAALANATPTHLVASPPGDRIAAVRLTVSAAGNEARYLIRERLAGRDLPNDAVGVTSEVSGAVVLAADGSIDRQASRISIAAAALASDQSRRDNYVRRNILETEEHPTITLVPTELRGLPFPLPTSGTHPFELHGVLTVRGVSRPTTWSGSATFQGATVAGSAATQFTFGDFELRQPRVPIVLSVADTIRLEYDFRFDVQQ